MDYVKLGSSDLKVSTCCLGTMTWGQQNSESEAHEQMDYALTRGVNFWDTAELYAVPTSAPTQGKTEEYIGTWFSKTGRRDEVILATKVTGPGVPWIRNGEPLTGKSVEAAIEGSLKRLQTDYIDLYQLHWPNRHNPHFGQNNAGIIDFTKTTTQKEADNMLDILQALDVCVKAGKVRHVGLSDDTSWGIMKYLELAAEHDLPRMVSIQNEFSLLNRSDDPYVAEVCVREEVAYMPWSPLATGQLSGKYLNGQRPPNTRWVVAKELNDGFDQYRENEQANESVKGYMAIAEKHGLDVCQMALAFCHQQNFVTSTIIGATNMNQLKTDIDAFNLTLSQDVLDDIDKVYRQYPMPF